VFEKRAKENHSSSVYRQTESRLERFKLVASRRFCLDSIFFTNLGRRQIEMDASIALRLALSVNRRAWSDLNLEHPKKYADRWFQPVQQNMLFNQDASFLVRAAATANLGAAVLQVLVPCAARGLVCLWAAPDSSRLWRVLGRPLDPLGTRALFGHVARSLKYGASLLVVMSRTPR
jgi:hypothetical protein